uniref:Uncharacterized protein n=1 Tax=Davidia involucrata TaxID=16924 RepID=A0A5B6YM16_DAVIN
MGLKVATTCLHWSQPSVPHSPSSSQTLASTISSPSLRRCSFSDGALVLRYVKRLDRSALFGRKLYRSRSCDHRHHPKSRGQTIKRACSASLDAFSDEEFAKKIQELAMRFQLSDDDDDDDEENTNNNTLSESESEVVTDSIVIQSEASTSSDSIRFNNSINFLEIQRPFPKSKIDAVEPPNWPVSEEMSPASIERKANSVELPLSLRIIKRKKQFQGGVRGAGESAYCSMKKAFSSMVFIIQELHSFTLQMREMLFYEDLQEILVRVQKEMNASFVWLFQQVFSHTPTLMVYVMILLANYSVYSMACNTSIAATPPPQSYAATLESAYLLEKDQGQSQQKFDSSAIKTLSPSSSSGKTTSIGGNNGGGGKFRLAASGTDGDGRFDSSASLDFHRTVGNPMTTREDESVSGQVTREEEVSLWNSIVEEATRMQAASRDEALDHETMKSFVSPVTAKIVADDDYVDYFRTELLYQTGLTKEPNNPLLLANYAQFLYLVARDYDRAEEYFKRAAKVEPPDAEALSKYASFLWQVRNDLWAAEETYLEAISADPSNSYYAANYAHFLWNTGGEDTCFPISSPDPNTNDEA